MNPIISIIIPCYNGANYITETLNSILNQDETQFEIIIIDDGSTDATEQIVKKISLKDLRIKYISTQNNGVSAARNLGLKNAKGEFIVFFDSDDIMGVDFLIKRYEHLKQYQNLVGCGSVVKAIDENGGLIKQDSMVAASKNALQEILLYSSGVSSVPSNYMFRKDVLLFNNISFDIRLNSTADKLFLVQLALKGELAHINDSPLYYRIHPNSMYHDVKKKKSIFLDNEKFVKIIKEEFILLKSNLGQILKKNYFMLAGAAWHAKLYNKTLIYITIYFLECLKFNFCKPLNYLNFK